ncbi:ribosome biogenesis protein BMS1 homolog [Papaver somniferum]|uniref:ribosome biogenesis protein BMS1 homolog n=1 Tax=Papaver somniferum TaxID=3469 RepID=UPI000E6FF2B2|nr:ribosome biogenesis protein BMS1 homolog [Papaver somniferum]XP_026398565.1 ribosome biogenesis protein BMS1 homolog [Papaver somniferum]XP_026398571.1 ribosome biogenesis protein BMS1 homolog [Papaver somniferum]
MAVVDHSAFSIFRGQRLYDDEPPLNKNTNDVELHRRIHDPTPYIVVVQGPRNVGKSLLIDSLAENNLTRLGHFCSSPRVTPSTDSHRITLPVTTTSGKDILLQFVECPDDISGMIDAAKYADVAILMVDASYGFEMETFEFRNLLQVHGFPKVIGVLTHLDKVDQHKLLKVKQRLEDHFCTEICEGAKVFSLCGLEDGLYKMLEIYGLAEMLSDSQFLPLSWRAEHPYVLVDHFEDVTPERVHGHKQFNRNLSLYGYLRGSDIKKGAKVHIAGAGDFSLAGITNLDDHYCDPYPLFVVGQSYFKTGNYLRLDILDVPPEIVENFDSHHPILVGGIILEEEKSGFMLVKLRRHSWHMNLFMSGVPITISAGWRRYQTNAIYAMENENGQHQLLTRTPENKDCLAVIWGPLAPPKTRIVAVLNKFYCFKNKVAFRIMAKGVVLDFKDDTQILLEVGRIGTFVPSGKSAHIMFEPKLQIDRFAGAI